MIRIITDSTASITLEEAKKLNINIVPLYVQIGEDSYKDRIDLSDQRFYTLLKHVQPASSQPTPHDFLEIFDKYKDDQIICITLSEKLSGTYQSAIIARQMSANENIRIINSDNASLGIRQLVFEAIKMRDRGCSLIEIAKELENLRNKVICLGVCDTLEYLKRGGRISGLKFFAGTVLNIKPTLIIENGSLQPYGKKCRGKQNAIKMLVKALEEFDCDTNYPIMLGYTKNLENAKLLKDKVLEHYDNIEDSFSELGTVIATHTGDNAFLMSFVKNKRV